MDLLRRRLRRSLGLLPMLALFGLLLTDLVLMTNAMENSRDFGRLYSWLLLAGAGGLVLLAVLFVFSVSRLLHQYWKGMAGARLTLRLVILFVMVTLLPVAVVYYFSVRFLQQGIDSWFDVHVEGSLEDSLELSRTALDLRMREAFRQAERMAAALTSTDIAGASLVLGELLNAADITELTLFRADGQILATANVEPTVMVPEPLPETALLQLRQGQRYVSLDPSGRDGYHIRVVVPVSAAYSQRDLYILQALFPVTGRFSELANSVQNAFDKYKELVFLRRPLKTSFILTLSLVMLFGVLAALWTAVYLARKLVEPVRKLAEGTQAVAAGHYDQQLLPGNRDELGFLVDSFNAMTRSLAQARDSAQRSRRLVEQERSYLEAVLARLSSGVLTLDADGRLRTANAAAGQILGVELGACRGADGAEIAASHPQLQPLFDIIAPHLADPAGEWRQELTWFGAGGRRVLMCRGSALPDVVGLKGGHVIVFDDITALVQAERSAAWAEVARRLAHEIKNPLTPIQLAAERIRHKYLKTMEGEQARVLDRSTHTIVQQVQAMKEMVDAFNEYARPPQLQLAPLVLNDFLTEVLYLYRDYPAGVELRLELDPRQPVIEADRGRLRQLVHNVVKNAIEAIVEGQGLLLQIATHCAREGETDYVELCFQDNGVGFPAGALGDIFEPYVTTKPKGTGLGLAIVKKIVEEHGGLIRAEAPETGGARIVVRFPMSATPVPPVLSPSMIKVSDTEEAG